MRVDDEFSQLVRVAVCLGSAVPDPATYDRSNPEFSKYVQGEWDRDLLVTQQLGFFDAMAQHGVEVVQLPVDPELPWQMYTRDTAFVVGETVFWCGERGLTDRAGEADRLFESGALPDAVRSARLTAGTIEGGDVLIDRDLLLVGSSSRTQPEAIRELERQADRPVRTMELGDRVMHLDTRLTLLGQDLALVHRSSFTAADVCFLEDRYELIDVTDRECADLATNVFVLSPSVVVVHEAHHRIIGALEARGRTVVPVSYSEPIALSGSFRCSTMPITRTAGRPEPDEAG